MTINEINFHNFWQLQDKCIDSGTVAQWDILHSSYVNFTATANMCTLPYLDGDGSRQGFSISAHHFLSNKNYKANSQQNIS